jgi:hypothetical protein
MKTFATMAFAPLLALAMTGATANSAQAHAYGYAQTTIENPTNLTLHYAVRWGDGEWVNYTLYPGEYRIHYLAYGPDGQRSPNLAIKFDYTLCDDEYVPREYALTRYAYPSVDRLASKRYVFRTSADGCFLDLYGVN